jgi:hypothetical protein
LATAQNTLDVVQDALVVEEGFLTEKAPSVVVLLLMLVL